MSQALIYGTTNPAKLEHMQSMLVALPIDIIGLAEHKDLLPEIDESGNDPLENARIKALAYYRAIGKPVFSCDSGLYFEGVDDDEQPGVHVRNVGGKRLSDDEMTSYYSELAARYGGKLVAQYKNAICLVMDETEIYEYMGDDLSGDIFYIVENPHPKRNEGFPLDPLSVHIKTGEYYYDMEEHDGLAATMDNGFNAFFLRTLFGE